MADKYNELSTSGWAVVSDKGKVFGSDSDNESGEQSDYVALENDVVHYHHSSSSSKVVEDEAATEEEVDELVSEASPALAAEPAGDLSKEPSERALSSEELAGATMKVDGTSSSDNNAGGRSSPDQVVMVPTLERGMSISDVIEDNVRARLNISRSRSSPSTSSTSGFLLDEVVNKSRGSHDDECSDTSGEAVNDVEMEGDVIDGRVEDVMVSKDFSKTDLGPEETVSDLDSEFEHLSQEDIPRDDGLLEPDREPDRVGTLPEGVGELDARPETSNASWIPSRTTSDDSDSSKLFHPGRGRKGIRKRFTARRSRHSSASNAGVVEEVAQRKTVARYKEFARGKFPYILLLVVALSTGYYIGSTQIISHKQHVEQGQTQRLHALQDELLSCLSSEEINNDQQVNKEIRCPDNTMKQTQIDFRELTVPFQDVSNGGKVEVGENNKDTATEEEEMEDWLGVEDTIDKDTANEEEEEPETEDWLGVEDTINKDTANEVEEPEVEDWHGVEDTINKDTANEEEDVWSGVEDGVEEDIPLSLWENTDEGENSQGKGNEMESVRGGDWMDIDAAIGESPHDTGIEMKSIGDWMEVEDAVNQDTERDRALQSGGNEKESIDGRHQIDLQDATISVRGGDWMDIDAAIGESPHDTANEEEEEPETEDWLGVEDTINKDTANEVEEPEVEDWHGVEDTINKDTANEEEDVWSGVEDGVEEDIPLSLWENTDEGENSQGKGNEMESVRGGDWMDIDAAIGESPHDTGIEMKSIGDWMEVEDAVNQDTERDRALQSGGNEKESIDGRHQIDLQDATISVRGGDWMDIDAAIGESPHDTGIEMKSIGDWMEVEDAVNQDTERDRALQSGGNEKESIDGRHQIDLQDATIYNNLDENNGPVFDEKNSMENGKLDKISEYEARISELEAHYKEIHELYKEKKQEPTELVQELYEKIIALESQLRVTTETKHTVKSDDASDTLTDLPDDPSDEPTWMNILSFENLKKTLDEAVKKTQPYYDKTKEAIGVANKATFDAFGKVYDYTKSEEFASNIANTQQKLQETLDTVNDAMSSQWEAVKKSSEDMSAYVRETGKNAKVTLAEKSEQVKKSISTLDLGKKLQELKNFTSADIVNKTKSTLRDLSDKVVQMKKYTQSDEFKSSVEKTKDTILESLDEAVQNTKESVSGFGDTLGDTWSNMKSGFKDIRSKATENWEAVKEKTGFGKKKNRDKKREHKNAHMKNKHNKKEHIKVNEMKNKHNKKKKSQTEDIENIDELLTGNWRQLYAKHFTMNCRGDQLCIEEQRDDAEILMQELLKYNEWLQRNNYKKDAKKIQIFFNELWPLVNGKEVDDQMLEDLKVNLGDILKSMHQRAKRHREQFVEPFDNQKQKKADVSDDDISRKDGRKFSGRGFHSDDDWHSKKGKRRAKEEREDEEEEKNYDWFTLRGMDRERERQGDKSIDGDWFLRRGKDRGSQRKWDSEGESADPNWYFKWTQSRNDMRTGLSMWDLYNWFHDWHDHRYHIRR